MNKIVFPEKYMLPKFFINKYYRNYEKLNKLLKFAVLNNTTDLIATSLWLD
jgi:hypothetical protein